MKRFSHLLWLACLARLVCPLCLGIAPLAVAAEARHELTLDSSVAIAVKGGYAASDLKARYIAARKNAESARRRLWTSVGVTVNAPSFQESLAQQFNPLTGRYEYYQLKSTSFQGNLSVNQPLVFTGGNLRFSQLLLSRNQTSGLSGATQQWRDYFGNYAIELSQPLLTPNTSSVAQQGNEIALAQVETDFLADQMDFVYRVTEAFYRLYELSLQMDIAGEQVAQIEESYMTAKGKYEAGLIPEVEVLQSEVDLASGRNEHLNTEGEVGRAKNAFRLLLGIPTTEDVAVVGEVAYRPVVLDSAVAVRSALGNRSEVLAAQRRIKLSQGEIALARSRNDFKVDLALRYGLDRNGTLFGDVFGDFNRSRSASLVLSIPVFDWRSHSLAVEAAEVQHRNSIAAAEYTRQQVIQEVTDLLDRIKLAESRIHVLERTASVAQRGYDISLERFKNGLIARNDLAFAQQRLTTAKMNRLSALVDYQLGIADLKRRTLWDFERNSPVAPIMGGEEE